MQRHTFTLLDDPPFFTTRDAPHLTTEITETMHIQFEIDDRTSGRVQQLLREGIPASRQQLVASIGEIVLQRTAEQNPVKTGRSRQAWQTAASQLTGTGGQESSSGDAAAQLTQEATRTTISATNHVPYIGYLEYGTSRMAPFAMLRSSLAGVLSQIATLFRLDQ